MNRSYAEAFSKHPFSIHAINSDIYREIYTVQVYIQIILHRIRINRKVYGGLLDILRRNTNVKQVCSVNSMPMCKGQELSVERRNNQIKNLNSLRKPIIECRPGLPSIHRRIHRKI